MAFSEVPQYSGPDHCGESCNFPGQEKVVYYIGGKREVYEDDAARKILDMVGLEGDNWMEAREMFLAQSDQAEGPSPRVG